MSVQEKLENYGCKGPHTRAKTDPLDDEIVTNDYKKRVTIFTQSTQLRCVHVPCSV